MTSVRPLLLFALLVAALPAQAVRFSLVVGENAGPAALPALKWAQRDAERVHEVWLDLGDVTSTRAHLLLEPDLRAFDLALAAIAGQVLEAKTRGERSELLFYFSGHGDEEALFLGETRVELAHLRARLKEVGADTVIAVSDACRTAPVRAGRARGASLGPAFDVTLVEDERPRGFVWIASARAGEVAYESDDLRGGFFTHHAVAGLRGAADKDKDGNVSLQELYRYARDGTLVSSFSSPAEAQHPNLEVALEGEGEIVLTRLSRASALLTLDDKLAGRFLVLDERRGRVVFEVEKDAGDALTLAVPATDVQVRWRRNREVALAAIAFDAGERTTLREKEFTEASPLEIAARGGAYDTTPWVLTARVGAGSDWLLPAVAPSARLTVERRLFDLPVYALLDVDVAGAWSTVGAFRHEVGAGQLGVGLSVEGTLGLLRLHGSAEIALAGVGQRVSHIDRERREALGFPSEERLGAITPAARAGVGASWRVYDRLFIDLSAFADGAVWPIADGFRPSWRAGASLGVGVEL